VLATIERLGLDPTDLLQQLEKDSGVDND